jgi:hypothetical protein
LSIQIANQRAKVGDAMVLLNLTCKFSKIIGFLIPSTELIFPMWISGCKGWTIEDLAYENWNSAEGFGFDRRKRTVNTSMSPWRTNHTWWAW